MQPTGQAQQAVANGGFGQGLGDHRLHMLLARGAVVTVDRVFGHHRLDGLDQIFNDTSAGTMAALQ
jgi:hypothetical protein